MAPVLLVYQLSISTKMKRIYKVTARAFKVRTVHGSPDFRVNGTAKIPKGVMQVGVSSSIKVPWNELRPMVAFAFNHVRRESARALGPYGNVTKRVRLELLKGCGWHGRAQWSRATVVMGKPYTEPRQERYRRFKDMPEYWSRDWVEGFVGLLAHELWHCFGPDGSGRKIEFDCELVEWDAITAWRKANNYVFISKAEAADQSQAAYMPAPEAEPVARAGSAPGRDTEASGSPAGEEFAHSARCAEA